MTEKQFLPVCARISLFFKIESMVISATPSDFLFIFWW